MHIRGFHAQAGLILHEVGRKGNRDAAELAQFHLDEALRQWKETVSASKIANAAYLAAGNERVLSLYDLANAGMHRLRAFELLREADDHIAALQMRYVELGAEAALKARIALHGQWAKVYELALDLSLFDAGDPAEAAAWVERWKGRAFAVSLGVRLLPVPQGVPEQILVEERTAIEALTNAATFQEIVDARDRLLAAWRDLAELPEAAEYVDLRAGRPISFAELTALLAAEERHIC